MESKKPKRLFQNIRDAPASSDEHLIAVVFNLLQLKNISVSTKRTVVNSTAALEICGQTESHYRRSTLSLVTCDISAYVMVKGIADKKIIER